MITLKSLRPHLYGTRRLEAGDEYEAPAEEAIALVATRKADFAKTKKPATAVSAPTPPTPEPEPVLEPEAEPEPETTLDGLRHQATQLGINVDGRWGAIRLQHEIAMARQR
jgi:hypothetical protein